MMTTNLPTRYESSGSQL